MSDFLAPAFHPMNIDKLPRIPWNKGKRKPITDELGNKWCNCEIPNLIRPIDKGLAYCIKCKNNWYH